MRRFLSRFLGLDTPAPRPRSQRRPLRLEALEDRQVPAIIIAEPSEPPPPAPGPIIQPPLPPLVSMIPALSSNPGASVKLYLDFDGHSQPDWQPGGAVVGRFNLDLGDPMVLSAFELNAIREIHARVSEDFAPFNIDVTTILPSDFSNGHALRVAIGDGGLTDSWSGAGGKGRVNSFTNSAPNVSWVFHGNLGPAPSARTLAEIASHEAGHGFGLNHQATYDAFGNNVEEYNSNGGSSVTAPIMGVAYSPKFSRWWYGTTTSATTYQDDMAVLAGTTNGFGYRADDHAGTLAAATWIGGPGNVVKASGIIGRNGDTDMFAFWSGGGAAQFTVTQPVGANLDARLEFRDSRGTLLPMTKVGSLVSINLPKGSIFLTVGGSGAYGDVGQYSVDGTLASTAGYSTTGPRVVSAPTSVTVQSTVFTTTIRVAFDKPMAVGTLSPANFTLISPTGLRLHPLSITQVPGTHGGRHFEILVPLSQNGTYRLQMGSGVTDLFGNRLDQNGDGIQGDPFSVTIIRQKFNPDA